MSITSTCPGCGSSLTIDETAGEVICQYCGTHFHVNLDSVNPTFQVTTPAPDVPTPNPPSELPSAPESEPGSSPVPEGSPNPADEVYNPPLPGQPPTPPGDFYNPPIPGAASTTPIEIYNPPIDNAGAGQPPFAYTPSSSSFPPPTTRYSFFTGNRLWITLAIVALVIFCSSCVCLLFAVQRVISR